LPTLSKIIEKIVAKQFSGYLNSNNLIYKNQYGFQAGKSTVHPLTHIIDYISKAFNDNEFAVAVFLDLQKAFDLVDHKIKVIKNGCKG